MVKRVILYLFLLFSLSLQAQTEEKVSLGNNSTEVDSTATAKPSAFKRAIKKFMNFSDFDTLYISPNRYNYALMVTHFSNFEYYSITSELPQPQKLSFSPNPQQDRIVFRLAMDFPGMVCRCERYFQKRYPKEQRNRIRS